MFAITNKCYSVTDKTFFLSIELFELVTSNVLEKWNIKLSRIRPARCRFYIVSEPVDKLRIGIALVKDSPIVDPISSRWVASTKN